MREPEHTDRRLPILAALLAAGLIACAFAGNARAAVIDVSSTADGPPTDNAACTLREAVAAANADAARFGCTAGNGNDTILLGPSTYTLTVPPSGSPHDNDTGGLDVNEGSQDALTITSVQGRGTIDASGLGDRALTARTPLVLANLTVEGGNAAPSLDPPGVGGAVATLYGAGLILNHVLLAHNAASAGGGAVSATGPLTVDTSTLSDNAVVGDSGLGGGAIDAKGVGSKVSITFSTIAGNSVDATDSLGTGGAIRYAGGLTLTSSILADNTADTGGMECAPAGGTATSGGFNVIDDNTDCGTPLPSDREQDPQLEPLADNGGPVQTRALPPSSPARNIGPAATSPACAGRTDLRGVPRGTLEAGACDAGALEAALCGPHDVNVVGTPDADILAPAGPVFAARYVFGLAGADVITGGSGADALCGGEGIDTLDGAGGADLLYGGPNVDIASYRSVAAPLLVTLDGKPNDGRAGEGDNVQTESVIGGTGPDRLTGGADANGILGEAGDDTIDGGDGNDSVVGGDGNDIVSGGNGDDQVRGDGGNDTLIGDAGRDRLEAGAGANKLNGGPGSDTLIGGPGKDRFACGPGRDTAVASKRDKVAKDCESVVRQRSRPAHGRTAASMVRHPG